MVKTARGRSPVVTDPMPAGLRALAFPIDKLQLDASNARAHGAENVAAIKASLRRYGWRGVVVAVEKTNRVLAGNARVQAARDLGWTTAPVLHVADDAQTAAMFAVADNRSAELASWLDEQLHAVLDQLGGDARDELGFTAAQFEDLAGAVEDLGTAGSRTPSKPKGDDSQANLRLTGGQLKVVLEALERAQRTKPKLTVGQFLRDLAAAYLHQQK